MKVIITIPAYNEEITLPKVLKEINTVMSKTKYNYQIMVFDDGSKDKTKQVAKAHGAIVRGNTRNRGLAITFRNEMAECVKQKADIIVHTDADGQYPAIFIPKLIKKVEEGYDLVLGSRFKGKNRYAGSVFKNLGNVAFAKVFSNMTKTKLTDTTTGFRAFTREVAEEISFINTFTYTQEQIIRASKQNFKLAEIPITPRRTRESRLFRNPLEYAFRAWINIFRIYRDYEPIKFFGKIGLTIGGIGFIFGIWLVYLFFTTGNVGHIPTTILSLLLLTTGIQIVLFGFLADMQNK